ncbi:MAG: lycopene cyclase family protein [Chitinophagaceae bacterium]
MSTNSAQKFDYVFLGAGCAALSIVVRMIKSNRFSDKKILLIDKAQKNSNDRTWCFWEKQKGFFEDIVYKKWETLNFYSPYFSSGLNISPYTYKMIRGIDFYNYCFSEIRKHSNIAIQYCDIRNIACEDDKVIIDCGDEKLCIHDSIVFNSIYKPLNTSGRKAISLLQHFKGWMIETEGACFDPSIATLMDFRVAQNYGTTFAYALPFERNKALIEFTLFTEKVLESQRYDEGLKNYIGSMLKIKNYKITAEEFGIIPMTTESFQFYKNGIYHIGTAGGQTKASSGYTFQFIQKQSDAIVDCLVNNRSLSHLPLTNKRFHFYDAVLLRILKEKKLGGDKIFSQLFKKNKPVLVFKFLDNETSLMEELRLISSLPTIPFLKAAIKI